MYKQMVLGAVLLFSLQSGGAGAEVLLPEQLTAGEQAQAEQQANACDACRVIRGKVLRNDHEALVIKSRSEGEISLRFDAETRIGQADPKNATFIEGARVEAYVTPDNGLWTVTQLKQQSGQPGADAEGD